MYPEAVTEREFHSVKCLLWECLWQAGVSWWLGLWGDGAGGGLQGEEPDSGSRSWLRSPLCGPGGWESTDQAAAAASYGLVSHFTSAASGRVNFPSLVVHLHMGLLGSSVWEVV